MQRILRGLSFAGQQWSIPICILHYWISSYGYFTRFAYHLSSNWYLLQCRLKKFGRDCEKMETAQPQDIPPQAKYCRTLPTNGSSYPPGRAAWRIHKKKVLNLCFRYLSQRIKREGGEFSYHLLVFSPSKISHLIIHYQTIIAWYLMFAFFFRRP